jgi:hypothetical protein
MSDHCDVILSWDATPGQLRAIGAALWRWWNGPAADLGICQALNNQPLADLIAGKLPAVIGPASDARGVRIRVPCEADADCQATRDRLRRGLPHAGVVDVQVDGASWDRVDPACSTGMTGGVTEPTPMGDHHGNNAATRTPEDDGAGHTG